MFRQYLVRSRESFRLLHLGAARKQFGVSSNTIRYFSDHRFIPVGSNDPGSLHMRYFPTFFDGNGSLIDSVESANTWLDKHKIEPSYAIRWLLKHYKMSGDATAARNVLLSMPSFGIQPDGPAYSTLISIYCNQGDISKSFAYYHEMKNKNLSGDPALINNLLRLCFKNEKIGDAFSLVQKITSTSEIPDISLLQELSSKLLQQKNYTNMEQLFQHLEKHISIQDLQMDRLLKETAAENPGRVFMAIQKLSTTSFVPSPALFNAVISGFIKNNEIQNVFMVPALIKECGGKPDFSHYPILLGASARILDLDRCEYYAKNIQENNSLSLTQSLIMLGTYMDAAAYDRAFSFLYHAKHSDSPNLSGIIIEDIFRWYMEGGQYAKAGHLLEDFSYCFSFSHTPILENISNQYFHFLSETKHQALIPYLADRIFETAHHITRAAFHIPKDVALSSYSLDKGVRHPTGNSAGKFSSFSASSLRPSSLDSLYRNQHLFNCLRSSPPQLEGLRSTIEEGNELSSTGSELAIEGLLLHHSTEHKNILTTFIKRKNVPIYCRPSIQSLKVSMSPDKIQSSPIFLKDKEMIRKLLEDIAIHYKYTVVEHNSNEAQLNHAIATKQFDNATSIIERLKEKENYCSLQSDLIGALLEADEMEKANYQYNHYITHCKQHNISIDTSIPGQFIIHMIEKKNILFARRILQESLSNPSLPPYLPIFSSFIKHHMSEGEYTEVLDVVREMKKKYQITPDKTILHSFLAHITNETPLSFVGECWDILIESGLHVASSFYSSMIANVKSYGARKLILEKIDMMEPKVILQANVYHETLKQSYLEDSVDGIIQFALLMGRNARRITLDYDVIVTTTKVIAKRESTAKAKKFYKKHRIPLITNADFLDMLFSIDPHEASVMLRKSPIREDCTKLFTAYIETRREKWENTIVPLMIYPKESKQKNAKKDVEYSPYFTAILTHLCDTKSPHLFWFLDTYRSHCTVKGLKGILQSKNMSCNSAEEIFAIVDLLHPFYSSLCHSFVLQQSLRSSSKNGVMKKDVLDLLAERDWLPDCLKEVLYRKNISLHQKIQNVHAITDYWLDKKINYGELGQFWKENLVKLKTGGALFNDIVAYLFNKDVRILIFAFQEISKQRKNFYNVSMLEHLPEGEEKEKLVQILAGIFRYVPEEAQPITKNH